MTDHTKYQGPAGEAQAANSLLTGDEHLLTSSLGEEGDGGTYPTDTLTRTPLESDCATEAQAHWLDNSLAFSAFFTASQYPNALWQTSSFPVLSTVELVDRVLDKKGLRRIIALQVGANIVTQCVPVVAKILHDLGHQCLCQSSVENVGSKVQDWLRQQVDAAVPELLWHAGRTPFARANYLMVLVEELFRTLPISWTDAIAQAEDGDILSHALECINQAVRCAEVEPQAVLGVWAAKHMIPDAHVSTKEQADAVSQTPVQEDYQSFDSIMLSPPDSECTTCLVGTAKNVSDDDAKSVGSTSSDCGGIRTSRGDSSLVMTRGRASAFNDTEMPNVRRSRASAPKYDMKRHPVDDMLGDVDLNTRKRRRIDHGERQYDSKRKFSPILIDD